MDPIVDIVERAILPAIFSLHKATAVDGEPFALQRRIEIVAVKIEAVLLHHRFNGVFQIVGGLGVRKIQDRVYTRVAGPERFGFGSLRDFGEPAGMLLEDRTVLP